MFSGIHIHFCGLVISEDAGSRSCKPHMREVEPGNKALHGMVRETYSRCRDSGRACDEQYEGFASSDRHTLPPHGRHLVFVYLS